MFVKVVVVIYLFIYLLLFNLIRSDVTKAKITTVRFEKF